MFGKNFDVEIDGVTVKNKSLSAIIAWKDNPTLRIVSSKKKLTYAELIAIPNIQKAIGAATGAIRKKTEVDPPNTRVLPQRGCNPLTANRPTTAAPEPIVETKE